MDALSDYLFVNEKSGIDNLLIEGKKDDQIFFVGDVMIYMLFKYRKASTQSLILKQLGVPSKAYGIVTLHRPSNVDRFEVLQPILETLEKLSCKIPIFFPVHPRTRNQIKSAGLNNYFSSDPLGYLDFLCLNDSLRGTLPYAPGEIQNGRSRLWKERIPCWEWTPQIS